MSLWRLALASLFNRRGSALLTLLTIAASVALLLAVERVRVQAKASFASTVSGTDLIVGARGGSIQLLLYAIFRIGDAPQNFSWESYQALRGHPAVAWTIPLALGDAYRGYRVLGTDHNYFEHYRYGGGQNLQLAQGRAFEAHNEAVLGAEVAQRLGHGLGHAIVVSHGLGEVSFHHHDEDPFTVVGILAATGTPVDRTVHISLAGLAHMHRDWQSGVHIPGSGDRRAEAAQSEQQSHSENAGSHGHEGEHQHDGLAQNGQAHDGHAHDEHQHDAQAHDDHGDRAHDDHKHTDHDQDGHAHADHDHDGHDSDHADHGDHSHDHADDRGHNAEHDHDHSGETALTAALIGLHGRTQALAVREQVNRYEAEALTAIMPTLTLQQLWGLIGVAEQALRIVALLVVLAGLLGLCATLVSSLNERRRELAVLRAVGAAPRHLFALLLSEALLLALLAIVLALGLFYGLMAAVAPLAQAQYGLSLPLSWPSARESLLLLGVLGAAALAGLVPAIAAYRRSLADGLSLRL